MSTTPDIGRIERLVVSATVGAEPFAGAWFEFLLPMWQRNEYAMWLGPSDESGTLTVDGDRFRQELSRVARYNIMDYTRLSEWTGSIQVRLPLIADIDRVVQHAYRIYSSDAYPPGFIEGVERMRASLETQAGAPIRVVARVEPADAADVFVAVEQT